MSDPLPTAESVRPDLFRPWSPDWPKPTSLEIVTMLLAASLTQTKFASITGVTVRTVGRWVSGKISMPYPAWCILADLAGVPKFWPQPKKVLHV